MKSLLNIAISAGFVLLVMEFIPSQFPSPMALMTNSQCKIKGNVSYNSGRKIYHLPGMEDYRATVIDPARGEKWFCTESEAIASRLAESAKIIRTLSILVFRNKSMQQEQDSNHFYFKYSKARQNFLSAATDEATFIQSWQHPLRGIAGEKLYLDLAWFGDRT